VVFGSGGWRRDRHLTVQSEARVHHLEKALGGTAARAWPGDRD